MFDGNVFYPFGTDDNGLPTERLIEKLKNVKSKNMSRSEFIELCLRSLKKITPDFVQDWKDLGVSCDYDIYYSTIDKSIQKISQKSFIDLFKKERFTKRNSQQFGVQNVRLQLLRLNWKTKKKIHYFQHLDLKLMEVTC